MGRINLTAVNVRKTALAKFKAKQIPALPCWVDVVADVPPAQILIRKQPFQHPLTQVRTRTLPSGKTERYTQGIEHKKAKSAKSRCLFSPTKLRYEEDALRTRFFNDHPWELARPRVVLETSGDQYKGADWSTGLIQPGIPLSGECVVQRQLWLLENIPDITIPQSYDIARKEFYKLRRREEIRNRIAAEEARHMGAQFGKSAIQIGMQLESQMYNDWEEWSRAQSAEMMQRAAAFEGTTVSSSEDAASKAMAGPAREGSSYNIGAGVFSHIQNINAGLSRRTGGS